MPPIPEDRTSDRYEQVMRSLDQIEAPDVTEFYIAQTFLPGIQHLSQKAVKAKKRAETLEVLNLLGLAASTVLTGIGGTVGLPEAIMVGGSFALTSIATVSMSMSVLKQYRSTHERNRATVEAQFREYWRFFNLVGQYKGLDRELAANQFAEAAELNFQSENNLYFAARADQEAPEQKSDE